MSSQIQIKILKPHQIPEAVNLIRRVFFQSVAPEFEADGQGEFLAYASEEAMQKRLRANHFALSAMDSYTIVGVVEAREDNHISLLFVDRNYQRQGIGKALLKQAIDICLENNPTIIEITVNASPNAVPAYLHLGFTPSE